MKNQRERKGKKVGKKSIIPSFLTKLYQILENPDYHSIVKWSDNGKAFVVKNLPEFIERVLPNYFKHNNFASFVRQLNMYDFHKTRNSNNENTFFHKMFIKGQRNLLKQIKRKVNKLTQKESLEDSEFSEIFERETKAPPKKNLEDIYYAVLKSLDEVSKKQTELEVKIEIIESKNDSFIEENHAITQEIEDKKNYTKNLEVLIILILENAMKIHKEDMISATGDYFTKEIPPIKNVNNSNSISSSSINTLLSFNASIGEEEKANLLKSLMDHMGEDMIRKILDKTLIKNNIKFEDINLKLLRKASATPSESNINSNFTSATKTNQPVQRTFELCETNVSSPTSLLSNNDCIFRNNIVISKSTLLGTKRKKTEDSKDGNEYLSELNSFKNKEKDSMFEEMTRLTPCMISSPDMSPSKRKKNEFNYATSSNIFMMNHKSSCTFNPDSFYGFNLEERCDISNLINTDKKNLSQ